MSLDLSIESLTVRFGGLVAAKDVSLVAPGGRVTSLIGPNGAGKSTTFNAVAGVVSATGSVRLGDVVLDRLPPATRARQGLGRTFQRMELMDSMTVLENVALGPEMALAGSRAWRCLWSTRTERRDVLDRAADAILRCGLVGEADRAAGTLSTGQRRLVELARAMASPFQFLMLDEPSSGLGVSETERFGEILLELVDDRGVGILLVEHDMALVRTVSAYTYVLEFGQLIYEGPTPDALASEQVQAAYLGSTAEVGS